MEAAGTISLAFDAMNGDALASSDRGDVDVSVAPALSHATWTSRVFVDCEGAPMLRREVDEAGLVRGALEAVKGAVARGRGKSECRRRVRPKVGLVLHFR